MNGFRVLVRAATFGLAIGAAVTASARDHAPATIVSVLVDLSKTWHNPQSAGYNATLLRSVGAAVADASPSLEKPVSVGHHVIGTASLARPPVCSVAFRPSLLGFGARDAGVEANPKRYRQYLTDRCPAYVLRQPHEPTTEIVAAFLSALQANAMADRSVPRTMIVLSDFKEESAVRYRLSRSALRNVHVILLWRTLPEDRRDPAGLARRISRWQRFVREHGGRVDAFADNAVAGSPAGLRRLIEGVR